MYPNTPHLPKGDVILSAHPDLAEEKTELTDRIIENICAHLNIRNWSFKTLSDTADIPYETVKKLLNGKIRKPSFYCIWQIAQALECTVDELAGNTRPDPLTLHINENSEEISRILTDLEAILKLN